MFLLYWLLCHSMQLRKEGKREVIWYLWRKGMTGSQILREMLEIFGHKWPSKATIYRLSDLRMVMRKSMTPPNMAVRLLQKFGRILKRSKNFGRRQTNNPAGTTREGDVSSHTPFNYSQRLGNVKVFSTLGPKTSFREQKRDRVKISKEYCQCRRPTREFWIA